MGPIAALGTNTPLDSLGETEHNLSPKHNRRRKAVADQAGLLPGTLDVLILKAVSLGRLHGYGVLLRIEQISGGALQIQQGALYPALYRLEHQGLIAGEWGTSDNNRKAKYYRLTTAGRKRLGEETASWNRLAEAIARALAATPQQI
jgi:transcriptional regulator